MELQIWQAGFGSSQGGEGVLRLGPAPGLEVLQQKQQQQAAMNTMPSRAWPGPFQTVLSEKYLHITEPESTTSSAHRAGGCSFQPQGLAFPALEIQLLAMDTTSDRDKVAARRVSAPAWVQHLTPL